MYTSILHFIEKSTIRIEKVLGDLLSGKVDLATLSTEIEQEVLNLGNEMVTEILEKIDQMIFECTSRKSRWYVEHKDQPRELVDVMGTLSFKRRGYVPKDGGKNVYLLDELLRIKPHQKVTIAADARVMEETIETSYSKGGRSVNPVDVLSKETVKKLIHDTDATIMPLESKGKKKLKRLYIVADEDHVAAQFWEEKGDLQVSENGYKINTIMPKIIVVYEGVVDEAPPGSEEHRYRLIGKHTFGGVYKGEAENYRLWEMVDDFIDSAYDADTLERVYIAGDGAAWIKTGVEVIEKSRFVLDKFHMVEYINKSVAHLENKEEIKGVIWSCIYNCDLETLADQYYNILDVTESISKCEEIRDAFRYLKNNWAGIEIRRVEETGVRGCCAEGQVSHVYSDRLSSRPMGWSVLGCDHMAKLRAFTQNGGKVIDLLRYKEEHRERVLRREEEKELIKELRRKKTGWADEEKVRAIIPGIEGSSLHWLRDLITSRLTS